MLTPNCFHDLPNGGTAKRNRAKSGKASDLRGGGGQASNDWMFAATSLSDAEIQKRAADLESERARHFSQYGKGRDPLNDREKTAVENLARSIKTEVSEKGLSSALTPPNSLGVASIDYKRFAESASEAKISRDQLKQQYRQASEASKQQIKVRLDEQEFRYEKFSRLSKIYKGALQKAGVFDAATS